MDSSQTPPSVPAGAPSSQQKGMHPMGWVGIGCGGLLIIALIAGVLIFNKAKDEINSFMDEFNQSPMRVVARQVVERHPDMEVVSENEEAGNITIRMKQTGEELTVDYGEVATGKLSFTASDGSVIELGQGDLADLPAWLPRYPDATDEVLVYQHSKGTKKSGFLSLSTTDAPSVVGDYYASEMEQFGRAQVSSEADFADGSKAHARRKIRVDGKSLDLTATERGSGTTQVQVVYGEE